MPREISYLLQQAIEAPIVRLCVLLEMQFASSTLRLWNGNGPLIWNDQLYLGNGWLVAYSPSSDTLDIRAEGFSITLSSVPVEVIALILNEARHSLIAKLYFAALDSNGTVVEDPFLVCEGFLDVPELQDDISSASVTITYESDLVDLDSPNESRYTDGEQQRLFPGDKGFEYVSSLKDKRIFWGVPADVPTD